MKYLIILFTLITISSCCKKVDGVCCDDGVYVRFENQTEYEVKKIILYGNIFSFNGIDKGSLSEMFLINDLNIDDDLSYTIRVEGEDSSGEFIRAANPSEDFGQGFPMPLELSKNDGCYTIILEKIENPGGFSNKNLYAKIINE